MKTKILFSIVILVFLMCFSAAAAPIPDKKLGINPKITVNTTGNVEIAVENQDNVKIEFFICEVKDKEKFIQEMTNIFKTRRHPINHLYNISRQYSHPRSGGEIKPADTHRLNDVASPSLYWIMLWKKTKDGKTKTEAGFFKIKQRKGVFSITWVKK